MWTHSLIALGVAVVLSVLLVKTLRRSAPGPLSGLLYFFIIIFFFVWAAGAWIHRVEPAVLGATWVVFTIVGVLLMLVIAAVTAPPPSNRGGPDEEWKADERAEREVVEASVSVFFWLALLGLAGVILASYLF